MPAEEDLEARLRWLERQAELTEAHFTAAFWTALDAAYDSILPQRQIVCPICGRSDRRDGYEVLLDNCNFLGGRLERYRCPDCECVFGPLKYMDLSDEFVASDLRVIYSRYSEADSTAAEIATFQSLRPKPEGLYLDWGCGGVWSHTISQLRGHGWNVWGYDPGADTAGEFVTNRRENVLAKFDGVFSNNVIEHFRNPMKEFQDLRGLLKPGGLMAHSSPCYEYTYAYTRSHTLFLMGKSPHVLAERTGFKVVDRVQQGEYINVVFARVD
jgi:SAM-dependent methyltransferase